MVGRPSVCLSVCLSHYWTPAYGGFADELHLGRRWLIDSGGCPAATAPQHGAQQQMQAVPYDSRVDAAEHRLVYDGC